MPLSYDNTASPYYSEAERTFGAAQDWTAHGADTLSIHFQGRPAAFTELSSGNILMGSAGADIWGTADEFRFAYKQLSGNGSIIARVKDVEATNAWAKAGVMIRESLAPGSTHAMLVVSRARSMGFRHRPHDPRRGQRAITAASGTAPRWVKVTRTGNAFTAKHSADGVTWVDVAVTPAVAVAMTGQRIHRPGDVQPRSRRSHDRGVLQREHHGRGDRLLAGRDGRPGGDPRATLPASCM